MIAEARAEAVLGEGTRIADRFHGRDMLGARYEPPFTFIATEEFGERGHTVVPADFVSADDGTGVVHTSISFGEDDFRIGQEQGIAVINPVKLNGTFEERMGQFAGLWVKDADPKIVDDLRARGRLLKEEAYLHSYPHCWRCGTPLLYYAKPSWYIATSSLRDRLLAANQSVDWYPEHIKHGRMGKWLENNVDWAISRERYWGTPLPIWRNEAGETMAIGSLAELEQLSGVRLDDPHRPYVDDVEIPSPTGGEPLRRVPEVIDVWFDSGSMPFAQWHAPHENEQHFEERFPADYICEAIDQTRGWFYSLLAISTLLFDRSPYRTCLVLGHIADEQGRKMSKSLGNVVAPWEVIDRHGADAFRWYFFTSKFPWDGYLFSVDTVGESLRQFLLQLWNTYGFLVLYTNVNDVREHAGPATDLDRWALSRLHATTEVVRDRLDAYDATRAGHAIAAFVDDLSNWYVRRSRARFWDGDPAACGTLHTCLVTVAKLLAPFCPFIADEIYDNLDGSEPSVHLTDFPEVGPRDAELEVAMGVVRESVRLGLAARGQAKLGVRQPLRAAVVVAAGAEREAIERLAGHRQGRAERQGAALRLTGRRARLLRGQAELPRARPALRQAHAAGGGRRGRARPRPRRRRAARRRTGRHQRRRARPRARRRRPAAGDAAARGLPARARGVARRRAGARARRRAGPRGPRARDRPRGPERAQDGRPGGGRPDRAHARRRRRAARRGARVRGLPDRRDARRRRELRRRGGRGDDGQGPPAAHRREARLSSGQPGPMPTRVVVLVLVVLAAAPAAALAQPPGFDRAVAELRRDGRELVRLIAAGDAAGFHARLAPEQAQELPPAELQALFDTVLAAGPIGERLGESALPLSRGARGYIADHRHGAGVLAIELTLDARDRVTTVSLHPRAPLPPDPAAGHEPANRLRLPLTGTWWVLWGGPDERRNYHVVAPDQRHAYDLVKWRRGATFRGTGAANADYYAFGRRVLAPARGIVVGVRDGVPDNRPQVELENPSAPTGNHVILDLGEGEYAVLAHLRRGSVRVRAGDRVRRGQVLGRVGNSGNSSEPHLHFHLQDSPTPLTGIGLPVVFRRLGTPEQGEFVRARRAVRAQASAGSSCASRRLRGCVPWIRVASAPSRKRIIVGIARMP